MKRRYVLAYGFFEPKGRVTVNATSDSEAFCRAKVLLDARYERADKEAPVAWDLTIIDRGQQ